MAPRLFRLTPLLRLREALERQAQRHLAQALQREEARRQDLAAIQGQRDALFATRRVPLGQAVDLARWRMGEAHLRHLDRRRREVEGELGSALAHTEARRRDLSRAHRDHDMLLRLRARWVEAQRLAELRREALESDERAVLRHAATPSWELP